MKVGSKEEKNKKDMKHRENKFKMADINLTISITTLNVNGLCNSILNDKKADSVAPLFDLAAHYKTSNLASKYKLTVLRVSFSVSL